VAVGVVFDDRQQLAVPADVGADGADVPREGVDVDVYAVLPQVAVGDGRGGPSVCARFRGLVGDIRPPLGGGAVGTAFRGHRV
jgi:hypothetical protein